MYIFLSILTFYTKFHDILKYVEIIVKLIKKFPSLKRMVMGIDFKR